MRQLATGQLPWSTHAWFVFSGAQKNSQVHQELSLFVWEGKSIQHMVDKITEHNVAAKG
jgi:hypothetical protein